MRMRRAQRWFIAAAALLVLAAFFRFALIGFIVSAMCCVFAAAVCVFFGLMRLWGARAAKTLSVIAAVCLALLFGLFLAAEIPVLADMRSDEDTSADYAVVFGAGLRGTEPSLSLLERLTAAQDWLAEHPEGVVIVSGSQGPGEALPEAQVMYNWLIAQGVSPERVLMEDQADNSYENLAYSLAMIEARGGGGAGRVALISSEYHLHRLCVIAKTLGCEPVRVAAKTGHISLAANYAVREAFAMWRIWVLGPG